MSGQSGDDDGTDRFIPTARAPHEMHPERLADDRLTLALYHSHHIEITQQFLAASDGNLWAIDMFLTGAMQRSFHLVDAFLGSWDAWNIIGAAPLVRLQIDTLIRVAYMAQAPDADKVATDVLRGTEFRKMVNTKGERLTDRALVDAAAATHPWLPPVYEKSNEWVHLSPRHVYNAWRIEEPGSNVALGRIPLPREIIPIRFLHEILGAMKQATADLFGWAELWESRKGKPPPTGEPAADDAPT